MKAFDETVLENQNWKGIEISGKWAPVVIESPDIINYDDTVSMIMRCEYLFGSSEYSGGNDHDWNHMLRTMAGLPSKFPNWIKYNDDNKDFWFKVRDKRDEAYKEFCKKWNTNPAISSDLQIFSVNLFSSSYIGGPFSFVNYSTGKVGLIHNIGKWPNKVDVCEEELNWFAKTYPNYKFFVTFCNSEDDYAALVTLMIYNGEIKVVTTRTREDWKYVFKINHLKGATSKNPLKNPLKNSIHRFVWKDTKLWEIIIKLSINRNIIYPLSKKFWDSDFAKNHLTNIRNERIIKHNDRIMFDYDNEKYFDRAHAVDIIQEWLRSLRR